MEDIKKTGKFSPRGRRRSEEVRERTWGVGLKYAFGPATTGFALTQTLLNRGRFGGRQAQSKGHLCLAVRRAFDEPLHCIKPRRQCCMCA
jgi:predicted porin